MKGYKHIYLLMKFGEKKFMEKFLDGEVYLNTVSYFRNHENKQIGDKFEGTISILNIGKGIAQSGQKSFEFNNLTITQDDYLNQNLFCLSCLENEEATKLMNDNNEVEIDTTSFNNFTNNNSAYCVAITKCKDFYDRLCKTLDEKGFKYKPNLVKYCDENSYSGNWYPFTKPMFYSPQREFRFVVNNRCDAPLILNIGSIRDIASLIPPNQRLKITFEVTTE